ncbi:MAG TPA: cysteine desulfurase family protein [Phycisphaerae bacterium]|nr:cysteine desulfurase family protein [Phycisphaerae bacterium]
MIYLDYNATTPIDPAVAEAMRPFIESQFGNPSSSHPLGRAAKSAVESARASLAALMGAKPHEIIFTSGGTEASNLAIKGLARRRGERGGHFVTTVVEHPATLEPMRALERNGFTRTEVSADPTGLVDPDAIRRAIRPDTILISVMHAQNEVGTIEPIAEIGQIARKRGVLFHVDAAQSMGKLPVTVDEMSADLLSIAGHKMYGPKGVGALYVHAGVELEPLIHGAAQESGRRGGTENVILIAGLGKAAELAREHLSPSPSQGEGRGEGSTTSKHDSATSSIDRIRLLRDHFWQRLSEAFGDRILLNGHPTLRLPNTLSVSFPGHVGGDILAKMPDVCASTGAACHAGDAKPSRVLMAMGYSRERAVGTIRFSLGHPTGREEIDAVVKQLAQAAG